MLIRLKYLCRYCYCYRYHYYRNTTIILYCIYYTPLLQYYHYYYCYHNCCCYCCCFYFYCNYYTPILRHYCYTGTVLRGAQSRPYISTMGPPLWLSVVYQHAYSLQHCDSVHTPRLIQRCHPYARKPDSQALLSRMQLTFLETDTSRRFALGASDVCLAVENPTCSVPAL